MRSRAARAILHEMRLVLETRSGVYEIAAAAREAPPPARIRLLQAALEEIERELGSPELAPRGVAERIAVSTRHLHRLFAAQGTTFGRWVLRRRLECARRDLADPAWSHVSIAWIATRWGFNDPSYFGRAFKVAYGVTPRAHRRAALRGGAERGMPAPAPARLLRAA